MNLLETLFWDVLFWIMYLASVLLILFTGVQGSLLVVVLGGIIGTVILTVFLAFQEDLLFETYLPVMAEIIKPVSEREAEPEKAPPTNTVPEELEESVEEREASEAKDEELEIKDPEVISDEDDSEEESFEEESFEGEEPEPLLRTDVRIDQFTADDDDAFSACD